MAASIAPHLTTVLITCRHRIGVHSIVFPTPPRPEYELRDSDECDHSPLFSYYWSYRSISANILLLTVRDYSIGILVLQESTIVAVLPRTDVFRLYFWLNHVWTRGTVEVALSSKTFFE